jgi:hypothetical protein
VARRNGVRVCILVIVVTFILVTASRAQERRGKPIGKVSVVGNLILVELDEGVLGRENLFDLEGRTLRFTPLQGGYRVENVPLKWDAEFGQTLKDPAVTLHKFWFPFSGKNWDAFSVGVAGSIRFGPRLSNGAEGQGQQPPDEGGVSIERFDPLSEGAANLVNGVPAICVFFKPRMSGDRYVKELDDRVMVTWDVTEPWGNIQDFTWTKTINRFQVALHKDGAIEMSFKQLTARDAIVGVYPLPSGAEKPLAAVKGEVQPSVSPNLNLQGIQLSVIGELVLKASFETAGPVLTPGDPGVANIGYRIYFKAHTGSAEPVDSAHADVVWNIRGFLPRHREGAKTRYVAFGPGVARQVETNGNTISLRGMLPAALRSAKQIDVGGEAFGPTSEDEPVAKIAVHTIEVKGMRNPEVHFSSLRAQDGPYPLVYESFHYYALPNPEDLSCTVIKGLGDKFDFLAYYSDFRVDNQEAGTPSNGPLGAVGGAVTGIGATQRGLESYCTPGLYSQARIKHKSDRRTTHRWESGTTLRSTGSSLAKFHKVGCRLICTRCRRSLMRWGIAGALSFPRKLAMKRLRWGRCIGPGVCRLR